MSAEIIPFANLRRARERANYISAQERRYLVERERLRRLLDRDPPPGGNAA